MFYEWLCQQVKRTDTVGWFARYAMKDKLFPRRTKKLHIILYRYEGIPDARSAAKKAHREWRRLNGAGNGNH